MKPMPVSAAEKIAKEFDFDQVIIVARKVGDGGGEHVTTFGKDQRHCSIAARVGGFLKHEIMGWHKARTRDHETEKSAQN